MPRLPPQPLPKKPNTMPHTAHADFDRPVLAIDTSTSFLSLALQCGGQLTLSHHDAGNRQSELILPTIRQLLQQANIGVADLGAIVYAQGPGTFTGLRIGIAVAQGLAAAHATALIGIPCLEALAALCPQQPCVLAATDARMNEVFYAWFDTIAQQRLSEDQVGAIDSIRLPEGHTGGTGCGNAFALSGAWPVSGSPVMPTAADYLRLAAQGKYPSTPAAQAQLRYVRNKIALTAVEQAQQRASAR